MLRGRRELRALARPPGEQHCDHNPTRIIRTGPPSWRAIPIAGHPMNDDKTDGITMTRELWLLVKPLFRPRPHPEVDAAEDAA